MPALRVLAVVVASFAVGCVESWAQGVLPGALQPLSNSASGWTLITVLLDFWSRAGARTAAVLGGVSFVLLVLGYALVSNARGFPFSPLEWGLIGVVVGPFVGVAASWLHRHGIRAALGGGLLAGIAIGEAIYGLTTVAATTGVTYWIGIGILGVALVIYLLVRRVRGVKSITLLAGVTVVTAALLAAALRLI